MSDVKGFSGIGGRDLESGRFPTAQMFGLRLRLGPLGGEGGSGVIQHSGLGGDQRLPEAVVAKQGVGEHDELADDGGDRDLVRFAAVGQPLVEDAHVGVAAAGGSAVGWLRSGVATKWWTLEGAAEGSNSVEGGTMVA